jgi:cell division septal protein FtsQ
VPKKLQGRWAEVKVIDLRYTNGFAVSWRVADASEGQKP